MEVMGLGLVLDTVAAEEFTPVIQTLAPEFERWAQLAFPFSPRFSLCVLFEPAFRTGATPIRNSFG